MSSFGNLGVSRHVPGALVTPCVYLRRSSSLHHPSEESLSPQLDPERSLDHKQSSHPTSVFRHRRPPKVRSPYRRRFGSSTTPDTGGVTPVPDPLDPLLPFHSHPSPPLLSRLSDTFRSSRPFVPPPLAEVAEGLGRAGPRPMVEVREQE